MAGPLFFALLACATYGARAAYAPVYGYSGAISTLNSGKTLHYYIRLNRCKQLTGVGFPEYDEPFGSHVTKWRTISDQNRTESPFVSFHEQIPVLNKGGKLESLSRSVQIWSNGTAVVRTASYSPDYSLMVYEYSHECTMSTSAVPGNIDFRASTDPSSRLTSFYQIVNALEAGEWLHFVAQTHLCPGGTEHNFSGLGGHVPNYEFLYDSTGTVSAIKVFVQTTIHNDLAGTFAAVIDLTIDKDNTVTIVDTRNALPNYVPMDARVTKCPLETATSGGAFSVYA